MAQHGDRFMRLMHSAEVNSIGQVELLTKEECVKLQIPWDLVSGVQKRIKIWKLEMTDDAEMALEKGEAHYQLDAEVQMSVVAEKLQALAYQNQNSASGSTTPVTGGGGNSIMHVNADAMQTARLDRLEELMSFMQQQNERFQAEMLSMAREGAAAGPRQVEMALAQAIRHQEQAVEGGLKQRLDELIYMAQNRLEATADTVSNSLRSQTTAFQASIDRQMEASAMQQRDAEGGLAAEFNKAIQDLGREMQASSAKAENQQGMLLRKQEDSERTISRKIEELVVKIGDRSDRMAEHLRGSLQADMTTMMSRTDIIIENVREGAHGNKESVADLRRIAMQVLENVNGTQEVARNNSSRLMELRGALDASMDRIASNGLPSGSDHLQAPLMQNQYQNQSDSASQHSLLSMGQANFGGSSQGAQGNFDRSPGYHRNPIVKPQDRSKYGLQTMGS
ncbi:unnamed protein product [Polarella glacialis]|uniref:Uncharacterized protein n=1 Tax=Polarella glacialis TaxID=89957 RepID=A0A813DLX1_POLGL|nr:unnamed protein product [Polarella glacialis]